MQDIKESLNDLEIMKIDGQPNNEDINQLKCQLCTIAASDPTLNRGGKHGQIGIIMDETLYKAILNGNIAFFKSN